MSQFVEFYTGLTYSPSDVQETGTLVLRSSNVKNGALIDADNVYVNDEVVDSENVRRGDIIVVVRNGSRALIGKHAEIREEMPKTVIGAFMTGIRSNHSSFVNALLSTQQFENEVAMNMGATINQITGYMFAKMSFMIPEGEEQDKIGVFFKDLDHLITLHQRKLDKLHNVKKSLLEKMFPRNGADVPEIRFSGFTYAWEQRKLGSIADKVTEKNGQLSYSETFTNSAEFGIISQRDFFDHDISNSENIGGYYVVRENDFVYNPRISVTAPCGPINCNRLGRNGVMSPLYTVFKTHDIDTLYLEWFFKSSYWHSFMYYNGDSGARSDRFSIKNDLFFMMPIPVPTEEEQRRIGSLLSTLDKAITLHQRKLEKLRQIKRSLLEKMFV